MVCELHFEIKTAILVIAVNTCELLCSLHVLCETTCQIVAWYEHKQHCSAATQRLGVYVSALSYHWRKK